jgi:hypothetical protein
MNISHLIVTYNKKRLCPAGNLSFLPMPKGRGFSKGFGEMTWGEFIRAVEAKGVTKDMELAYLDLHPSTPEDIKIEPVYHKRGSTDPGDFNGISITSTY